MTCTCHNQACQVRIARNLVPFCQLSRETSAPRRLTKGEVQAMCKPGQVVVTIYPGMGHGPASYIIRGRAQA